MTKTITIESINADGSLKLSDNGVTVASPGDTILWIIAPKSGVKAITAIQDNSSIDVFNPNPAPVGGSSNWSGQVTLGLQKCEEDYTIIFTRESDDITYKFDPKIQVDS
ncbi:hypothetical protein A6C57_26080 [Fibrella sp. ES10-3-2-2]